MGERGGIKSNNGGTGNLMERWEIVVVRGLLHGEEVDMIFNSTLGGGRGIFSFVSGKVIFYRLLRCVGEVPSIVATTDFVATAT